MSTQAIPSFTLNNGVSMPQLGLGVYKAQDGKEVTTAVKYALETGYRLIDTAALYGNERGVGQAVKESHIPREEIFVTTKLWNDSHDYEKALRAFDTSMVKLGLDYLDLYLIHWPVPAQNKFSEAWRALEKLYEDKRVRAIGVCNFKPAHFEQLLQTAQVVPMINQIELHPRLQQHETREFCMLNNIQIESWSPLMRAGELMHNDTLTELADKYGKTPAQIILRWHVDSGFVVIPKSVHTDRIDENMAIFDFQLDDGDMAAIAKLDGGTRIGPDPDGLN
jgi:2,5-diketo-D-gluconate reductase A